MSHIERRSLDQPDETMQFDHGRSEGVEVEGAMLWRSVLGPGWSWDTDIKPIADGLEACPMTHREYVVAGSIRYLMIDGQEVVARAGDHLFIPPGHRGWVLGDEDCVLIDW